MEYVLTASGRHLFGMGKVCCGRQRSFIQLELMVAIRLRGYISNVYECSNSCFM